MGNHFEVGTDFLSPVDRIYYSDLDNDGWNDLELEFEEFLTMYTFLQHDDEGRKYFWDHQRLDWSKHMEKLWHKGLFAKRYQMPKESI
jgi:hypothetical protein